MTNFLNIGYGSINLDVDQVEKYNKIISWKETIWLSDWNLNSLGDEIVEVFLFKTRRSYYIRFATSLFTGSPVVVTKELGLEGISIYAGTDCEGNTTDYMTDFIVVDLDACKDNTHITNSSKKWKGLPSLFDQSQTLYEKPNVLGPSDFKTISFNLKKEYDERNKHRIAATKAAMKNLNGRP